ncbi:MAG TPA: Crp/Fnr family transcriptional regulator [Candidatus Acidoferrales bacterium]|nr:Crp/Fnr family transcriptional regulator [Candidatus Acidoferrales bacterium]
MQGPYGFEMSESCQSCKVRNLGFFCQFTPKAVKDFDSLKSASAYPEGAVLFMERQDSRGVFVICQGEVKLTISSSEGKTLITRIAKAGEILGLMSVLSAKPYEVTAVTLRPCQVAFVRRDDFLRFLAQHPEASLAVMKQLSANYHGACEQLRTVGLSSSAGERLARLLLEWAGGEEKKPGTRIKMPLTHEEIAECIGSTRETVTRTLTEFKNRQLVVLKGSTLFIANRAGLENMAAA